MIDGFWERADRLVIAEIVSFKFSDRPFLKLDKVQRDRGNTLTSYSAPPPVAVKDAHAHIHARAHTHSNFR